MNNKKSKATALALAGVMAFFSVGLFAQEQAEKLTLRQAVALAVQNSRELALARIRQAVAERSAGVTHAEFRPNLFTGSGAAYTNGFPLGAPTVFNLSYVQTLLNSPLRGELRAAQGEAESRRAAVEQTRDSVMLRAALAYLELAKVRHSLQLLRNERVSAQRIFDVTRERASEGLELPVQVTRDRLTAARIEQRIVESEGREEDLEGELRSLLGLPASRRVEVAAEELPLEGEKPFGDLLNLALANNLEIKQAEIESRAREQRLKGERGGYLPTLDLIGEYGIFSKFNNYKTFYSSFERHNVTVGIRARIPIFSARTPAAVSLARTELNAADLEFRNKRSEVERQVRRLVQNTRERESAREVARLEMQLAQEDLRVLQAKFEEGHANLREVETARLAEHNKWMQFLDADYARQQAHLELLRATGQLAAALR